MASYIVRRLFYMVLLLILLSFVAFAVIQLPPGDWIDQFIYYMERFGIELDESAIEALNKRWGFRDPFYVQYWSGSATSSSAATSASRLPTTGRSPT